MEETPTAFFAGLDVAGAPRELVALGGRLDVETLLAAYRAGCFPWPAPGPHEASLDRDAAGSSAGARSRWCPAPIRPCRSCRGSHPIPGRSCSPITS
jgi:hypothetical protein